MVQGQEQLLLTAEERTTLMYPPRLSRVMPPQSALKEDLTAPKVQVPPGQAMLRLPTRTTVPLPT